VVELVGGETELVGAVVAVAIVGHVLGAAVEGVDGVRAQALRGQPRCVLGVDVGEQLVVFVDQASVGVPVGVVFGLGDERVGVVLQGGEFVLDGADGVGEGDQRDPDHGEVGADIGGFGLHRRGGVEQGGGLRRGVEPGQALPGGVHIQAGARERVTLGP
jgi:hypothetical protein